MATYQRFEDLPVWQAAAELYDRVDQLLHAAPRQVSYAFGTQLERAALSISNNIAEGFERGTRRETLTFIYIARGSAGEVRSMLTLLSRRAGLRCPLRDAINAARTLTESCSRQLRGWAVSLQNSEIDGQRHLNRRAAAAVHVDNQSSGGSSGQPSVRDGTACGLKSEI